MHSLCTLIILYLNICDVVQIAVSIQDIDSATLFIYLREDNSLAAAPIFSSKLQTVNLYSSRPLNLYGKGYNIAGECCSILAAASGYIF